MKRNKIVQGREFDEEVSLDNFPDYYIKLSACDLCSRNDVGKLKTQKSPSVFLHPKAKIHMALLRDEMRNTPLFTA